MAQDLREGVAGVHEEVLHVELLLLVPTQLEAWGLDLRRVQQVVDALLVDLDVGAVDCVLHVLGGLTDLLEERLRDTGDQTHVLVLLGRAYLNYRLQVLVVLVTFHRKGLACTRWTVGKYRCVEAFDHLFEQGINFQTIVKAFLRNRFVKDLVKFKTLLLLRFN